MALRIAYARIAQESNALSPVRTEFSDFERTHYLEGEALEKAASKAHAEVPGLYRNVELSGFVRGVRSMAPEVELVPTLSAWAIPSGPLSRECFERLVGRLEELLSQAGKLDGVYVCLHGAMCVDGVRDPETLILQRASRAAGGVPVAATYDLHANITKERVAAALISCAYRTNPHRDHASTGERAARLFVRALKGEIRPVTAWRSLPMLLGGGTTLDFLPPLRSLFARMKEMVKKDGVLDASTCMSHPWNNDPALGWSTLVITDGDRDKAEKHAEELAERCWQVRHRMPPAFDSAEKAIEIARRSTLARKLGVVMFCETSDIVNAGATGDSTLLIGTLLAQAGDLVSYASMRCPATIENLWALQVGDSFETEIGARLDPTRSSPLKVQGRILFKRAEGPFGRLLTLDLGSLKLVVTEGLPLTMKPSFFTDHGLPILAADIIVVKNLFPFRLFFLPYLRKAVNVRTRGLTDLDAAHVLEFDGPMHPRDVVDEWRSRDRMRRGLAS